MLRFVVFVIAITGVFAAALAYGGMRMGAWEKADPIPPSGQAPLTRPDDDKGKKKRDSAVAGKQASSEGDSGAKTRWVREANALCRRAERETSGLKWPRNVDKAAALVERLAEINRRYNDAFAALKPAKPDRAKVAKLLALFERDEALIDEYLSALRSHQLPRSFMDVLNRLAATAERESALLFRLGAADCAAGFFVPSVATAAY